MRSADMCVVIVTAVSCLGVPEAGVLWPGVRRGKCRWQPVPDRNRIEFAFVQRGKCAKASSDNLFAWQDVCILSGYDDRRTYLQKLRRSHSCITKLRLRLFLRGICCAQAQGFVPVGLQSTALIMPERGRQAVCTFRRSPEAFPRGDICSQLHSWTLPGCDSSGSEPQHAYSGCGC